MLRNYRVKCGDCGATYSPQVREDGEPSDCFKCGSKDIDLHLIK